MNQPLLTPSSSSINPPSDRQREGNMLKSWFMIFTLCLFIALLSFKPSEPYLTEYLLCNYDTQSSYCSGLNAEECSADAPCIWNEVSSSCSVLQCSNVTVTDCGNDDYYYCYDDGGSCRQSSCYQHFTEDEVNNDIYPWSTYSYLPFLLFLGPLAELISYRVAILFGILGRVATRILLLFGRSLFEMQIMQVSVCHMSCLKFPLYAYTAYCTSEHSLLSFSLVSLLLSFFNSWCSSSSWSLGHLCVGHCS